MEMPYRPLGKTEQRISAFGIGGMIFGWKTDEKESNRILDRATECGINIVDTSNTYGGGRSEEIIGKWLKQKNFAGKILIATKFHHWKNGDNPENARDLGKHIIAQCEDSLRRLNVEAIDVYQLHRPGKTSEVEEVLRALDQLVHSGKVRWTGTSTHDCQQLRQANKAALNCEFVPFSCEQTPYNLLDRRAEVSVFPATHELGLGVLIWSPLAEGILTGKYRRGLSLPSDSRFASVTKPGLYGGRLTESVFGALESLEQLARLKGCTPSEVALAWCARSPNVSSVLIGPSTLAQLDLNLRSLEVSLDQSDLEILDRAFPPAGYLSPYLTA